MVDGLGPRFLFAKNLIRWYLTPSVTHPTKQFPNDFFQLPTQESFSLPNEFKSTLQWKMVFPQVKLI